MSIILDIKYKALKRSHRLTVLITLPTGISMPMAQYERERMNKIAEIQMWCHHNRCGRIRACKTAAMYQNKFEVHFGNPADAIRFKLAMK